MTLSTSTLSRFLRSPRFPFIAAFVIACGLFGGAVFIAETWRLAACPLCILQRMACLALAGASGIGLLAGTSRPGRIFSALLMLACTLSGVWIAAYQSYIQRVAQDIQCSGEAAWWELFVDWAGEKSPLLFQASGLCVDPAWVLFGLSLAEYALLGFLFLTLLAGYALYDACTSKR